MVLSTLSSRIVEDTGSWVFTAQLATSATMKKRNALAVTFLTGVAFLFLADRTLKAVKVNTFRVGRFVLLTGENEIVNPDVG